MTRLLRVALVSLNREHCRGGLITGRLERENLPGHLGSSRLALSGRTSKLIRTSSEETTDDAESLPCPLRPDAFEHSSTRSTRGGMVVTESIRATRSAGPVNRTHAGEHLDRAASASSRNPAEA